MRKVVFIASSGGHLNELLELEKLFKCYNYLLITEKTNNTLNLKDKYNVRFFKRVSRTNIIKYFFNAMYNVLLSFKYILIFKPEVVITTGANTGGTFCCIAKLFRKKIIYIETIAQVEKLSYTGKIMYKRADKFFVQWEDLKDKYKKSEYLGRLK